MKWLVFIGVLVCNFAFCQTVSWDLRINKGNSNESLRLIAAIEDSWGNYVMGGNFLDVSDSTYDGWLVKVSPAGDTLMTRRYTAPSGSVFPLNTIIEQNDGYLVFGALLADDDRDIVVMKVDFDLNELWTKRYGTPEYLGEYFSNVKLNAQGNYVAIGVGLDMVSGGAEDFFIYELDQNGDSLRSAYFPFPNQQLAYDMAQIPGTGGYKAITIGTPGSPNWGGNEIVTLDSNFTIQSVLAIDSIQPNVSGGVFQQNSAIRFLNDSTFLAYGRIFFSEYPLQPGERTIGAGVLKFDLNNTLEQVLVFGKPDTTDFELFRGLDFLYKDAIYAGCTANWWIFPTVNTSQTYFNLNKIDSTGAVLWQKYYGGDDYYFLYSILATQDGGCLMIGTINDSAADANNKRMTDIYLIKVGPDGLLVSANETMHLPEAAYKVFPNPATTTFTIQGSYALPAVLELYDMMGRQVYRQPVTSNRQQVDVSQLAGGLYVYRLVSDGKVARGKIILE